MPNVSTLRDAIEAIRSTADQMRRDTRFKSTFEEYHAVEDDEIAAWEQWLREQPEMSGYEIPPPLKILYRACGGFRLQWQYIPDVPKVTTGSANIVSVVELYQREDEEDRPVIKVFDTPRAFDVIGEGERVELTLRRAPGKLLLTYVDDEEHVREPLTLDPIEYVIALGRHRARYGWQRLYVSGKAPEEDRRALLQQETDALLSGGDSESE